MDYKWKLYKRGYKLNDKAFLSVLPGQIYIAKAARKLLPKDDQVLFEELFEVLVDEEKQAICLKKGEAGIRFIGGYCCITLPNSMPRGRYYLIDEDNLIFGFN